MAGSRPARRAGVLRRAWVIPIVAALSCGRLWQFDAQQAVDRPRLRHRPCLSRARWTRFPVVAPSSAAQSGSTIAADEWFSKPQVEDDTVDAPTLLSDLGIDPASTRYMGSYRPRSVAVDCERSGSQLLRRGYAALERRSLRVVHLAG